MENQATWHEICTVYLTGHPVTDDDHRLGEFLHMLALTRTTSNADHTTITIGDDIEITILETRGDEVRIGIRAPCEVCVVRTEIASRSKGRRRQLSPLSPNRTPATAP